MLWNCQERGDLLGVGVILVGKVMIDLLRLIVEVSNHGRFAGVLK